MIRHMIPAATLALAMPAGAQEETLRMATIAPNLSQAVTMATFANVVNDALDDVSIEVAAGGAATVHMLEMGRGNLDMSMISPTIYALAKEQKAMYANQADAPAAMENVSLVMWFPYGAYHFAVRPDSGIEVLDDIEGATVFLGPQGGGAFNAAQGWIEATTGLVAGEDYEAIAASWATGWQAFLDGTVEMYTSGCLDPCQQFLQFTETEPVRFIEPADHTGEAVEAFLGQYRFLVEVPDGLYENQVNERPIMSNDTWVGIGARADLDEDTVYRMTRAFWENLDEITTDAPWARALNIEDAVEDLAGVALHPGAARYYREVGAI